MWVTCYTDASFSRRQGGAWAVWLRSAEGRIVRSGACPDYVRDATGAELCALYAGVYLAVTGWPGLVRGILLRSDSQDALRLSAADARRAKNRSHRRVQDLLRQL